MPAAKKTTGPATKKGQPVQADIANVIQSEEKVVIRERNLAIAKCEYIQVNDTIPSVIEMNKAVLIEMALTGLLDKDGKVTNCTATINDGLDNKTIVFK